MRSFYQVLFHFRFLIFCERQFIMCFSQGSLLQRHYFLIAANEPNQNFITRPHRDSLNNPRSQRIVILLDLQIFGRQQHFRLASFSLLVALSSMAFFRRLILLFSFFSLSSRNGVSSSKSKDISSSRSNSCWVCSSCSCKLGFVLSPVWMLCRIPLIWQQLHR